MATWGAQHRRFENLMRYRIRDILLVSSPYDYFTLEEGGWPAQRAAAGRLPAAQPLLRAAHHPRRDR